MSDIYDPNIVKGVFDRCSDRYIAFSLICSLGFTERWRRQCVAAMPPPPSRGAHGYDLMAGTGEIWPHLLKRFDDIGSITAVDISSGMHRRAMARLHAHRAHRIEFRPPFRCRETAYRASKSASRSGTSADGVICH